MRAPASCAPPPSASRTWATQLSGSYKIARDPAAMKVNLTGKLKFGTANEQRGLGTGATDYTLQLDLFQTIDAITPFASFGYRWLGDKGVFQLDNGWFASAGAAFRIVEGTSIGAATNGAKRWGPAATTRRRSPRFSFAGSTMRGPAPCLP